MNRQTAINCYKYGVEEYFEMLTYCSEKEIMRVSETNKLLDEIIRPVNETVGNYYLRPTKVKSKI